VTGTSLRDKIINKELEERLWVKPVNGHKIKQLTKWFGHITRQKELNQELLTHNDDDKYSLSAVSWSLLTVHDSTLQSMLSKTCPVVEGRYGCFYLDLSGEPVQCAGVLGLSRPARSDACAYLTKRNPHSNIRLCGQACNDYTSRFSRHLKEAPPQRSNDLWTNSPQHP
jgi:hypothetical protein